MHCFSILQAQQQDKEAVGLSTSQQGTEGSSPSVKEVKGDVDCDAEKDVLQEKEGVELFEVYHIVWLLARRLHTGRPIAQPLQTPAFSAAAAQPPSTPLSSSSAAAPQTQPTFTNTYTSNTPPLSPTNTLNTPLSTTPNTPSPTQPDQNHQHLTHSPSSQPDHNLHLRHTLSSHAHRFTAEQERLHARVRLLCLLSRLRSPGVDTASECLGVLSV